MAFDISHFGLSSDTLPEGRNALFVNTVQTIRENQTGIRRMPGTAIANAATGEILHTPLEGETIIPDKLKNLEVFIHTGMTWTH